MTFQDLPRGWGDGPLDHDLLPDVVDLLVSERERFGGCLMLLIVRGDGRLHREPILISELPLHTGPDGSEAVFHHILETIAPDGGTLVVARGRRGPAEVTADDAGWSAFLRRHLGDALVGFFLATPGSVIEVRDGAAAA
ncbi:hypothetical protein [Nocardioides sp. AE5]|uniref:hypothetical protein n=1 Tax=Nocardioides sp. AE5 TaxID=2962573 RepID=UPI002880D195|nr:hypothetical protein [Nocardioides sp. AE5]MDT0202953.1 hypothetical protein [Nocardioides sp. AE5]